MPYELERNDQDPVRSQDIWRRVNKVPMTMTMEPIVDSEVDWFSFFDGLLSWQRRTSGGRRSIGYMERYEAIAMANILVNCAPTVAREMA